jgi:RecB family exonuclease
MLAVLYREREPEMEIVGVEQPFDVPLIDLDTGEVLDRALVGTLDLLERDAQGGLVVVDLKTSARKYSEDQASYCNSFRACGAHSGYWRRSR